MPLYNRPINFDHLFEKQFPSISHNLLKLSLKKISYQKAENQKAKTDLFLRFSKLYYLI